MPGGGYAIRGEGHRALREVERLTRNPEKLANTDVRCWKDTLGRKRSFKTHRPPYPTRRGLTTAWQETKKLLHDESGRSGGASPLFVAGQSQVISRTRKGSQHIYYTGNVLRVLTFQILCIVSKTSKFRTCLTVIRNCTVVKHTSVFLHTYAIKLILSHRSNEVE